MASAALLVSAMLSYQNTPSRCPFSFLQFHIEIKYVTLWLTAASRAVNCIEPDRCLWQMKGGWNGVAVETHRRSKPLWISSTASRTLFFFLTFGGGKNIFVSKIESCLRRQKRTKQRLRSFFIQADRLGISSHEVCITVGLMIYKTSFWWYAISSELMIYKACALIFLKP